LEWLGHVIIMNETRYVNKIFEGKLEGRRGRGRPRLRWINDVEDDLRKFGVKRWRTKALDRDEWASIIREAKAKLKGLQRYKKKKKHRNHKGSNPMLINQSSIVYKLYESTKRYSLHLLNDSTC